jgi:hypothetical protein
MTIRSPDRRTGARRGKVERPHAHFTDPMAVVADNGLTTAEKAEALAALEQDARQLAIASNEGMVDGEPDRLRAVRLARHALTLGKGRGPHDRRR